MLFELFKLISPLFLFMHERPCMKAFVAYVSMSLVIKWTL